MPKPPQPYCDGEFDYCCDPGNSVVGVEGSPKTKLTRVRLNRSLLA